MFIAIGLKLAALFGQRFISDRTAKNIGIAVLAFGLLAILGVGKCAYDKSVVAAHEKARQAELDRAALKAEREANRRAFERQQEFVAEQTNVVGSIENAIANDPEQGRRPVGPVSQSYYDSLRARDGGRQTGKQ